MGAVILLIEMLIVIVIVFGTLGFLLFVALPQAIKLLKNNHKNTTQYTKTYKAKNQNTQNLKYSPTGWIWDEKQKLWVHPSQYKKEPQKPTYEDWKKDHDQNHAATNTSEDSTATKVDINFRESYQAKRLLTQNEWQNYKTLKDIAKIKNYIICPKVRLWDIIEPRRGEEKQQTLKNKIQAKHVDFIICDQNMNIKAIIELDDSSHDKQDRKERDEFVDMILRSVGYKVIHTKYITNDILDLV